MIFPGRYASRSRRRPLPGDGLLGGALLAVLILAALLSPWLPLPDPLQSDLAAVFKLPARSTGWVPINWAATCSRAFSPVPVFRCSW